MWLTTQWGVRDSDRQILIKLKCNATQRESWSIREVDQIGDTQFCYWAIVGFLGF